MGGFDVQAKVRSGLAKAHKAVGSSDSPPVFLVTESGGGGTPSNPIPPIETLTELVNAIFKSIDKTNSSGQFDDLIQSGDVILVCSGDVPISPNQFIQAGQSRFLVVDVAASIPAFVPLSYTCLLRVQ